MAEHDTLLAHLVPKLTSQVENAATDALAFILNASAACRNALDGLLRDGDFKPGSVVRVDTQVTYEDGSRPDMVGYDQSGAARLLVEAKFWAILQPDQATRYVEQLEEAGPGVLLFIAPDSRIETLRAEIGLRMESGPRGVQLEFTATTDRTRRAKIVGSDKRLMLVSWDQLLGNLAAADDPRVASDIQQLRGLARQQDEEAFQPIHSEELAPTLPRRLRGLNRLIDDVRIRGVQYGWMNVHGLAAAPQREGYGRYFRFIGVQGEVIQEDWFLCVHFEQWATSGDTPLWLRVWTRGAQNPISRARAMRLHHRLPSLVESEKGRICDVPIYLKTGVEYERVLEDVVRQIRTIGDMLAEL